MKSVEDIADYVGRLLKYLGNRYFEDVWLNQGYINETIGLFSDEQSRDLYCREIASLVLANFLTGEMPSQLTGLLPRYRFTQLLERVDAESICPFLEFPPSMAMTVKYGKAATFLMEQYAYEDKVRIARGDVCLDCGGCLGDTAILMCEQGAEQVYAFEIDKRNMEMMVHTLTKFDPPLPISIIPHGLSSQGGSFFYVPNKENCGAGQILNYDPGKNGAYEVSCITIDDFCERNKISPNFIKMDIEGAELHAIQGGEKTFKDCRPKFAVCTYHMWRHRWEVPLLLKKYCPDYDFYYKRSTPNHESVILGCPKIN